MLGLAEAVPTQADMLPVAVVVVMVGNVASGSELTVILKVTAGQPPTNFPSDIGPGSTGIVAMIELVLVLITKTLLAPVTTAYTLLPSRLTSTMVTSKPVGIVAIVLLSAVLITDIVFAYPFES